MASIKKYEDDFVIYDYELENAVTCNSIDDAVEYGRKIGFNGPACDDFATKVLMVETGTPFEFKGRKFIVWDDEFEGYHQYHASTKKSKMEKSTSDALDRAIDLCDELSTVVMTDVLDSANHGNSEIRAPILDYVNDISWALGNASVFKLQDKLEEAKMNMRYDASTKKSKSSFTFTEQVAKQRTKNNTIQKYNFETWTKLGSASARLNDDARIIRDAIQSGDLSEEAKNILEPIINQLFDISDLIEQARRI